ncbi:tyrosine-type recombinase/integrase [Seonamhaeicola aphaedonensis]|uniref:Phage integrase family protein n=1 Tax=Seonamhaeicola aphaedonensis TaxID=1461338 RepID=A0A3D9HGY7_9FLAO|nr:tyrosine-type recombinase/integrase [Seonamhaeicola aphaedonensis]RED48792.1 phage integrase family protein [Seonamhaeicola aphaedonensis]
MATIKFYPYLKTGKSKVYVRVTIKRGQDFRLSTTLTIKDATKWNPKSGLPRKNEISNKKLYNSLLRLEERLENEISEVEKNQTKSTTDISSQWVKEIILDEFNESVPTDKELLVPFGQSFVDSLPNRTYQKNGVRKKYSIKTINKYQNIVNKISDFQDFSKKKFKVNMVDDNFADSFLNYLTDEMGLSVNTKGGYIKRLKKLIKEAEISGLKVNSKYRLIRGFEDETIVTFLTFDEIDKIIEKEMPNKRLEIAKDWLIIGCYTAQRVSDMYRMKKNMIVTEKGIKYISLKQYKTGKQVFIPVHHHVEDVLKKYDNNFPPNFSDNEQSHRSLLSALMKKVCEIAEINEKVRGRFNGKIGIYPKYKLIQNHSCRRSFASNFYGLEGWTTPMIMEITGHDTEKSFYRYIDKDNFYLSIKAAENFAKMKEDAEKAKKETKLKRA